jgi:adenylyltransferase/sulfurtransferase
MLTPYDLKRYDRQIQISGFGKAGQSALKNAKILISGLGGLGFPISVYLVAAGVGRVKIVDHDVVELSNLNRQLLHWDKDIGRRKGASAFEKLSQMNPQTSIEPIDDTITDSNIYDIVDEVDAIVDAMDNFPTRYLLNKAALEKKIPLFHGGVYEFMGQATTILPGRTACLKCIFPQVSSQEKFPILGSIPGVIGGIQVTEVIKYFTKLGNLLENKLLVFDGKALHFDVVEVTRNPHCPDCKSIL